MNKCDIRDLVVIIASFVSYSDLFVGFVISSNYMWDLYSVMITFESREM